jgi:hypothetical protein
MHTVRIARHRIDQAHAAESYRLGLARLADLLPVRRPVPGGLPQFGVRAVKVAQSASVAAPHSPELPRALRLAARAFTALFPLAADVTKPPPQPISALNLDACSLADPINWTFGALLAAVARHEDARGTLLRFPVKRFTAWTWDLLPFWSPLARGIHAVLTNADPDPWLDQAQRTAIGIRGSLQFTRSVKKTDLPVIKCLATLNRPKQFGKTLVSALRDHKAYYGSTPLRRGKQAGWLPVCLLGVAALAHDRGIPVAIESDYLPTELVTGTAFANLEPPDDGLDVGADRP